MASSQLPAVISVVLASVLACTVTFLLESSTFLYLKHVRLAENSRFFIAVNSLTLFVPGLANPLIGYICDAYSPAVGLPAAHLTVGIGLVLLTISRISPLLFVPAYSLYAILEALRAARLSVLARIIPSEQRTQTMAINQLMIPTGAVLGSSLWVLFQNWRGEIAIRPPVVVWDRFTLVFTFAASVSAFLAVVLRATLPRTIDRDAREKGFSSLPSTCVTNLSSISDAKSYQTVSITLSSGSTHLVHLPSYRRRLLVIFSLLSLGTRITVKIVINSFSAILVQVFDASEAHVGHMYQFVAALSFVPPLMVALLARKIPDRIIITVGFILKLFGITLMLPLFGAVAEWQVLTGLLLTAKGSMFVSSSLISIFTKVIGSPDTAQMIGWMCSIGCVGPAIVQLISSRFIVDFFGGWQFGFFGLPLLMSFGLFLFVWGDLNVDSELTARIVAEIESVSSKGAVP